MAVVGLSTLRLHIPHARTLKDRRAVVQSIRTRLRARFNVAVAEVEPRAALQEAVLAVAAVGERQPEVAAVLAAVERYVEEASPAQVVAVTREFF